MNEQDRFRRVDELFRAAFPMSPEARTVYLDEECGDDEYLKHEILSLLEESEATAGALDQPALGEELRLSQLGVSPTPVEVSIPDWIGKYRIISRLGAGGMSVVYEAEQDNPRRTVALKVISPGIVSSDVLRRFEYEAEVLGRLKHPGIAQIYEAGTFDAGAGMQPYFALELIQGQPLTKFANNHQLETRQRLELLVKICDAVQHAHQHGVIHRDLKPDNILVDESGQPRILDFGVARATDADIQRTTLRTDIGQLIGTIPYMSPEQAAGDPGELDTRSDVYALGVVAYELLAGRLPYDLKQKMVHEAVRVIREDDPTPLSSLSRMLGGDIETIVSKALEKDKTRRYQSAEAIGSDIHRYLHDEPISARPPSAWYQFRKFTKRHRQVVGGVALLVFILVGSTIVSSVAWRREAEARAITQDALLNADLQRKKAERQAKIATAINDFLNEDLLAQVDPRNSSDRNATVRDMLDTASESIRGQFPDEPLVEAALQSTLGSTYLGLSEYDLALPHLERAVELKRNDKTNPRQVVMSIQDLCMVYMDLNRLDEAEPLLQEALALCQDLPDGPDPLLLDTHLNLGELAYRRQDLELATTRYEAAVVLGRKSFPESGQTLNAMASLALIYQRTNQRARAESLHHEVIEGDRRLLGDEHPYTLTARNNLALLYLDLNRFDEAESHFLEILEIRRRTLGQDHSDTLVSRALLARLYVKTGRYEESETFGLSAYEGLVKKLGASHPYVGVIRDIMVNLYRAWEKPEEAAKWEQPAPDEQP